MKRHIGFCWVICAASITVAVHAAEPLHFAADRPVDSLHIKLTLNVDVANKYVSGTARIDVEALRDVSTITLDAKNLDTTAVKLVRQGYEPTSANYINSGEHIEVLLDEPLIAGQQASIIIEYSVDDPQSGLHFFGPTENEPDVSYVVWSQGESTYNSNWFPCFDNPRERQTTELVITAKRGFEVSGNGRLISRTEDTGADTTTFHWLQDKPHPAYLVSMIVGDFHIERDTWRGKPVTYWSHPQYKERLQRTFKNTKRMLDFFSDAIGIEYPWDRYAQICCEGFGGGMENTSATTLGTRSLHDERSIIDSDSDGLIAHELAHQWWGDLLTCSDWAHIWLNEGFASYFEALWDEHDLGDDEFRYNMYRKAGSAKRGGTKAPIVDRAYKSPGSMFDSRAYSKGAWVLHMMRKRIGDSLYWQVMKKYGTDNAYKTVETVDLRKAVEAVTGRSFERFFYDWTERPGHPEVTVTYKWLNDDKLAKVSIKQTQEADAFHFPLTLEFRFDDATGAVSVTRDITEKEMSFYYPLTSTPKMLRVDPGQTVLMELKEKKGKDLWKAQLRDDPNPVARIRAAKHFGESKSKSDHKLLAKALETEKFWGVQREIARALGDTRADVARDALISGLKLENHKARRACVEQLAKFHEDAAAIDAVRPIVEKGDASYYVESAAIETFAELEPEGAMAVLIKALKRDSRNEVIRSSALSALGDVRDEKVIDVLTRWTRPDKPRRARPAAIRALAKVTNRTLVDDEHIQQIVDALEACLDDPGRWVRSSAVRALGRLSDPGKAKRALPALRTLAAGDSSERVRKAAERTIDAIESGKPAQVQLADMRKDLKAAMEQYDELAERFDKLESSMKSDETESQDKEVASAGSDDASGQEE